MASNLHKDLTDLQLHVPKGFAGASNGTTCQKDATGNLVWAVAGGGSGKETNTTSWRGSFNNKSGGATNWKGLLFTSGVTFSTDFGTATIGDFSRIWSEIIPATIHVVTSTDPTLVNWSGNYICVTAVTIEISLWKVTPDCLGGSTGTLTLINQISSVTSANIYECFDIALTTSLLKGDLIIPLIKSSANGLLNHSATIRMEQL
tara:strand:- start:689 stop:1300 length:612 start_codon:yes stop_codon:yes gene_type:complete